MSALYLDILETLYKVQLIGAGLLSPYATFIDDLSVMLKEVSILPQFRKSLGAGFYANTPLCKAPFAFSSS